MTNFQLSYKLDERDIILGVCGFTRITLPAQISHISFLDEIIEFSISLCGATIEFIARVEELGIKDIECYSEGDTGVLIFER